LRDESGVLVVPGDHFEMDGYLRIGFGSDASHLAGSLARIGALLETIPTGASADAR
jgi:aspartate/methionine/tyrosine aminotransferase